MSSISTEDQYWVALNMVLGVGKTLFHRLIRDIGPPREVFLAAPGTLRRVDGIGQKTAEQIRSFDFESELGRELAIARKLGAGILTLNHPAYPRLLKDIYDPPPVLYYQGVLPEPTDVTLAVVGTRAVSSYGRVVTQRLTSALSSLGVTVVSGMARGVDTLAHLAALEAGGKTVAVFGCGLDHTYPPENRPLRGQIQRNGCLFSEFPLSTRPDRNNFPARNRVIAGMCLGTLVIEAGEKSGALITAEFALEQGREVFAVPGNITSSNSRGTNQLIQTGAKMVTGVESIVEELPSQFLEQWGRKAEAEVKHPGLTPHEQFILDLLSEEEAHIDNLIQTSRLSAGEVSATLLQLEVKGLIRQTGGNRFISNRLAIS
ncbi:MAG: DNA-processing protein DprA [Nitrospinaceae bacterium]